MATKNSTFGIKEAAAELGCDQQYVRKLIQKGKLEASLIPLKEGSSTKKYQISAESVAKYREATKTRTNRPDGRNKFVMYLSAAELATFTAFCLEAGIPAPVMPNKGEYEKRRAAKEAKVAKAS